MGNSFCSDSDTIQTTQEYLGSLADITPKNGVSGGSVNDCNKYGGLENYANSVPSKSKEYLIRSIAKHATDVLKIKANVSQDGDLLDIIEKLKKVLPDPSNGRNIKTDSKVHKDVCKKLGTAINKAFDNNVVNLNESSENICLKVSQVLNSLTSGLNNEFVGVSNDISKIVKNLNVLQDHMDNIYKKLSNETPNSSMIEDLYKSISKEIKKQHAHLAGLVNGVIGPTKISLINLLESGEMPGLSSDMKAIAGTRAFSDRISHTLYNSGNVSHAAYLVNDALKQIGMSLNEYKNANSLKKLNSNMFDNMVKNKPSSNEINKMMGAYTILLNNDLSHDDIVDYLSKKGGFDIYGGDDVLDDLNSESFAELIGENLYDDYDSAFKGRKHADKKSIGRTLRKRAIFREKLFSTLNEQIKSKYTTIIMNLYKIGKKLGSEIKISNNIRLFIKQLVYFEQTQPDRYNLHKALSGYRTDVKSEYIKHDFIKSLESVVNISTICDNEVGGGYFKDITNSINGLLKVVDDFNATFTKSLTEIHVDADRSATGGDIFGGVAESEFKYLVTMKKAVRELEWYFKISNIKGSLKVAASQQKNYTADYENILGEECGILIDKINETFKLLTCENDNDMLYSVLDEKNDPKGVIQEPTKCIMRTLFKSKCSTPGTINAAEEKIWDAYVFLMEYMRSANVDMIEAAQAIDLYLSAFTEQAQNNPDEIKDFLKMLEQLEIVAKWFTDKSGDNLAFVFESFGVKYSLDDKTPKIEANSHYYTDIKTVAGGPADHNIGITITDKNQVKEFIIRLEKSFKSMRALENIISTFSKINISSKNSVNPIMSPGLIFKAFTKYAIASSIGILKQTNPKKPFYKRFKSMLNMTDFKIYLMNIEDTVCNPLYIGDITTTGTKSYIQPIEIFEMCIKSIVSKVAIVVGVYALFQKPAHGFINNNSLSNNPLRQILGGESSPKIIPDAVELYVRLTLLGEWYRDLFKFKYNDTAGASDNLLISMIPSFDGIWNKFIKVIFVDAAGVNEGGYTETFSIDIVESINDIYTHYKSKYGSDICIKVMENFVAEINLRYGIIKQDEINNYIKDKDRGISNLNEYDSVDNVNFDILDADLQFGRNKVPSDKFIKSTYKNVKKTELLYKNFKLQIEDFRKNVSDDLTLNIHTNLNLKFGDLGLDHASVDDLIIQTKNRVNNADDDAKKFKVIQTTIMGVDKYSDIDYDIMIMFHETVINPLTILYTVYKIINQWNKFAIGCLEKYTSNVDDVKNLMRGNVYKYDNTISTDLYMEHGFDHTNGNLSIINRTLHHLFYLTCDKNPLVEVYFSNSGMYKYPMLSFKKLEEYVIPLVECVEKSLNKFRNILPYDIINKYENSMYTDDIIKVAAGDQIITSTNVVSLFFIKEHFIDRLLKNKYGGGLNDSNTFLMKSWKPVAADNYYNVFYNEIFLFSNTDVDVRDMRTYLMKYPINQIGYEPHNSSTLLKTIVDGSDAEQIIHPLIKINHIGFLNIYDYDDAEYRFGSKSTGSADNIAITSNGNNGYNGLIFKFNRLIFHYINMFIDNSSGKIYLPLLEKFANGINAGEIMRGNAIDDITASAANVTKPRFTDADVLFPEQTVIFATQAVAIKNLVTARTQSSSTSILKLAEPNLLNISEYMKDLMTAYLPIFEKHLNIIINRADMLKNILDQSAFNMTGSIPSNSVDSTGSVGYAQKLKSKRNGRSTEINSYFTNTLAYLGASAKSLQKCIRESYKELNDLPLYFETYKNSISDYKNRNTMLPFMPLSHVSHLLNNNIRLYTAGGPPRPPRPDAAALAALTALAAGGPPRPPRPDAAALDALTALAAGGPPRPPRPAGGPDADAFADLATLAARAARDARDARDARAAPTALAAGGPPPRPSRPDADALAVLTARDAVGGPGPGPGPGLDLDPGSYAGALTNLVNLVNSGVLNNPDDSDDSDGSDFSDDPYSAAAAALAAATTSIDAAALADDPDFILAQQFRDFRLGGAYTQNQYYSYKGLIPHRRVGVGTDEFKFAYGTRGLLSDNNDPNIELSPGIINILDTYNSKIGGSASYDKRHMIDCFKYSTYLLRYAVDYIYHKTYLCDEEIDKSTEFFNIVGTCTNISTGIVTSNNILHNLACQTGKHAYDDNADDFFIKTQNISLLLENDSYKHSVQKMIGCITHKFANSKPSNRRDLRIYNILDANIVPINFHALQREIPLINLFNYSHTFDLLVDELNKNIEAIQTFTINSLVSNLKNPFNTTVTWNNVGQIMSGNDGLELNRPKYLSDQLWGKVLLMSAFTSNAQKHNASRYRKDRSIASTHLTNSDSKHTFTHNFDSNNWSKIGEERYKTYIVRYMEWFVHLQRYMRYIMRNQLAWVSDPIAHRNNAISESITEYEGNRIFKLQEFE